MRIFQVLEALEKYPDSQEISETVCLVKLLLGPKIILTTFLKDFTISNNTSDSIYAYLGSHPERAGRFGNAMAAYLKKPEQSPHYITDFYDWASLGE